MLVIISYNYNLTMQSVKAAIIRCRIECFTSSQVDGIGRKYE